MKKELVTHDLKMKQLDQEILNMEQKLSVLQNMHNMNLQKDSHTYSTSHELNQNMLGFQSHLQSLEVEEIQT